MVGRKRRDIPTPLARGRDRFEVWRRTRKVGARIPDKLWSLAVKLVDAHGLNRTASVLRLDYYSLKKRVEARNSVSTPVPRAFIELASPSLAASGECVVEFEDGSGASIRVHLRGCDSPDLVALGRIFWSSE
ncbi:MAG: hypothetical protein IH991_04420 [Planctomycetes bacterium]|nr:hypothetical protein [Planctomycetota bacterium]